MIQLAQEDVWAFNIINSALSNAQGELQRIVAARAGYIKMLETKYNASFDAVTGQFKPNQEEVKT